MEYDMEEWINDSMSELLDFSVPHDLSMYIMQIQDERDLDEYLKTLLNLNDPRHRQFIEELKNRQSDSKKIHVIDNVTQKQDKKKGKIQKSNETQEKPKIEKEKPKPDKKKTKFVNLYSDEGKDRETVLLKGRYKCDCEARQHKLINNCINCGRIVCVQEGAGPCFFCGELVCSQDQRQILSMHTKQAQHLYNKLMDQKPSKSLEDSIKSRDKLLEYDRNSAQRTKVIDDESDYFLSTNTWLTKTEREAIQKHEEELMEKKHESRLNRKVTLDFAGRRVIDEEDNFQVAEKNIEDLITSSQNKEFIYPETELPHRPIYVQVKMPKHNEKENVDASNTRYRVQDKEFLEIADDGKCLSMHQPYASLLVAGIKTHEGRTWYTSHRGRLWIASAAKVPKPEDISIVENQYRVLKGDHIKFPQQYPVGCLLGCVTVMDVLPQEEYQKRYPEGESDSPYVFICEDFYELPIKFPIQGKFKIYKLDEKIHRAAVNSLEKVMKNTLN